MMFRPLLIGILIASLLSPAMAARVGPEGPAFYDPPAQAAGARPGRLIWSRPLTGAMALPGADRNLLILYQSRDARGRPVAVSGTLAVPHGKPPAGGWPIINWTHGTMGLERGCAPSRVPKEPPNGYVEAVASLLDGFVRAGYAVVATDYQGLGTAGPHPYMEGRPNALNALDLLPAARAAVPALGRAYVVVGHSQGGQAALFAASEPRRAPGFQLKGVIALAPVSQIASRLAFFRRSTQVEPLVIYLVAALAAYARDDDRLDIEKVLTPGARDHLADLAKGCRLSPGEGFWANTAARDLFAPDLEPNAMRPILEAQEPGRLAIRVPALIVAGSNDGVVPPSTTAALTDRLCRRGAPVTYRVRSGADHVDLLTHDGPELVGWVAARFASRPDAGSCRTR